MSHSRRAQMLLAAMVLAVAASCGVAGSVLGTGSSVTGTVTYAEQIELTPGATLIVRIRDTSYADASAELIAEQVITDPGQVPIKFEVSYDRDDIDSRNTYSVSARIEESDGRLAFVNDTAYDVITRGNPKKVHMVLVLVEPPPEMVDGEWSAEDRLPVEEPVHVTGTDIIWEGEQVYVHVRLRSVRCRGLLLNRTRGGHGGRHPHPRRRDRMGSASHPLGHRLLRQEP